MYLTSESFRILAKSGGPKMSDADTKVIGNYKKFLDTSTRFIPTWVKVAVALALGLGHDDRVEADRGDGWREDRQDPPDLCSGSFGGTGCDVHPFLRQITMGCR